MSGTEDDPRCPECGGPIGQTSTYCMHCSADLTAEQEAADVNDDETWDETGSAANEAAPVTGDPGGATGTESTTGTGAAGMETSTTGTGAAGTASSTAETGDGKVLADDGLVDDTLTVLVGIAGGIVVGLVGTIVLLILTESGFALLFGFLAWLGATAYLVRRRTVQEAVSKGAYAVALVLLLVPLVALAPGVSVDGGVGERGGLFVVLLVFVALPAGAAAVVGWIASRFVPDRAGGSGG